MLCCEQHVGSAMSYPVGVRGCRRVQDLRLGAGQAGAGCLQRADDLAGRGGALEPLPAVGVLGAELAQRARFPAGDAGLVGGAVTGGRVELGLRDVAQALGGAGAVKASVQDQLRPSAMTFAPRARSGTVKVSASR